VTRTTNDRRPLVRRLAALSCAGVLAASLTACSAVGDDAPSQVETVPSDVASMRAESASPSASASGATSGSASPSDSAATELSYPGQDGKTALDLLLENDPDAQVEGEGEQAMVTGINGRTADDAKKEFWALYVDGQQAQVGAGSLETKDGQTITWKLETY
jgi:hypothetical protein